MFRLLFELNRRMPNGTYGGVRGIINLYSIRDTGGRFVSALLLAGLQKGEMTLVAADQPIFLHMAQLFGQAGSLQIQISGQLPAVEWNDKGKRAFLQGYHLQV